MIGQVFTRLTVVAQSAVRQKGEVVWACSCVCGAVKHARGSALRGGYTKSCGCLQRESRSVAKVTHGMSHTRVYRVWAAMWGRCTNPNTKNFADYGGRGIAVCARWRDFKKFLLDLGEPPAGALLERVNNNKGYSPSNCRWATRAEQNQNKRTTRYLTAGGETLPLVVWAKRLGIRHSTLRERLERGWSEEQACTTPTKRFTSTSNIRSTP
jgi:hypothetical protein